MNIRDRMSVLFTGKLPANSGGDNTKVLAEMVGGITAGSPVYPETNYENLVRNGWRKNELIYACISKTANTASQVELQIVKKSTGKQMDNHPLTNLLQSPNPHMTEFDLWSSIHVMQKLAGRALFEKERNRAGEIIALWPLRPDWVEVIPEGGNRIGAYKYTPPGTQGAIVAPEDVLDFKLWDPLGLFHSWPPVAVASRVADVDNMATDHIHLFFEKGGVPPFVLKTVQKLRDSVAADIRRRWSETYGGHQNWTQPAVLDADASIETIGLGFAEMGFDVLDSRSEARICQVLDVPPMLVSAKIGLDRSTYENWEQARKGWWEDTLVPAYVNLQDAITNQLMSDYGDNSLVAVWNFDKVYALQEERHKRWDRAIRALMAGGITRNEFYAEVGMEGTGAPGDVYLQPLASQLMPKKAVVDIRDDDEDGEVDPVEQADQFDDEENSEDDDDEKATGKPSEEKFTDNTPDAATISKMEKRIERKVRTYLADQYADILEATENGNG